VSTFPANRGFLPTNGGILGWSKLRHDFAAAVYQLFRANHQTRGEIVFLADVFEQLRTRSPVHIEAACPRHRIRAGIVDRDFILHVVHVDACEPFDRVQPLGMRQPLAIDPKRLVVSHSVYDESLTFPVADRMSVVTRSYVLRMLFRTHIDEAPGVRATD